MNYNYNKKFQCIS